jgi:dTDP-glucose pyrophosphorylase
VGIFRGLVPALARSNDELCHIAGRGCPYTLPIGGRPLIRYAIQSLRDAGAEEVLVVVDPDLAEEVAVAVGDPGLSLHYAFQESGNSRAVVQAAQEALGPGPVLVHLADALLAEPLAPEPGTIFTSGGRTVAYALEDVPAERLSPPGDGACIEVEGTWCYDGTIDGVLEANSFALDGLKRARIGADLANASVQGRVAIHPTAVLEGAKIRGPVCIGPEARIVETYIGPYTSIGAGVELEGVEIENSIVLPGAQIRYPGRRLESSLVGEGAQISRDYALPSALRLRVGPNSEIHLS